MPDQNLLTIMLSVAAIVVALLYLRTRRRRRKKSAPPVRPAAPANQTAGVAATWAPPTPARPASVAPTMVAPPGGGGWAHRLQPERAQADGARLPLRPRPLRPPARPRRGERLHRQRRPHLRRHPPPRRRGA